MADLEGRYVIPGLINTPVHLFRRFLESRGAMHEELERMMLGGVVAVRDMAGDARVLAGVTHQNAIGVALALLVALAPAASAEERGGFEWFPVEGTDVRGGDQSRREAAGPRLGLDRQKGRGDLRRSAGDSMLTDEAYSSPDHYIGERGLSWLHLWSVDEGEQSALEPRESPRMRTLFLTYARD